MAEQKFSDALKTTLENVKNIVEADTIIGEPINTPAGVTIIPVSKIMVGIATGGVDYIGKHTKNQHDRANSFSGAGGSGVTVSPVAFIVIKPDGDVSMMSVNNPQDSVNDLGSSVLSLLNKTPDIVNKVKDIVKSAKSSKKEEPAEELDLSDIIEKTDTENKAE